MPLDARTTHGGPGRTPPGTGPLRLAILGARGIPARYGGFETVAEELARRLVREGIEVTVFCELDGAEAPAELDGVRLEHVRVPARGGARALLYDLLALFRARRGFDVVYMLGYGAGAFLWIPRLSGSQVWVNMDGREWQRRKWGFLARRWLWLMEGAALRCAQRAVFDNSAVCRAVLAERASSAEVSVIEYGAALEPPRDDPELLESLGLLPGSYYLAVARLEPENNVLEIVRSVPRSGTQREVLVVGDLERSGRYAESCRREAGPRVRFLGAVFDRATLRTLRSGAWAVIHGHSVGGTNPSLLEALAAGAPVIAHENPFNREVLEDLGLWFRDEPGLVEAVRACEALDEGARARARALGLRRIESRYSWERITGEYARLLRPERAADQPAGAGPASRPEPSVPAALPGRVHASPTHAGARTPKR